MLIDWFTVGAQAVNFAILAWLLKRLLYKPIRDSIDAREQHLASQLAEAQESRSAALQERAQFERKLAELEAQRADLVDKAVREARAEGQRLLDEARRAADDLSARRHEALLVDAQNLDGALALRVQQEVFSIVRKVLADLATAELGQAMVEAFLRRLDALQRAPREALRAALGKEGEPVLLRCAFDLGAPQRGAVQGALARMGVVPGRLLFEVAPQLVAGLELSVGGWKLAWSVTEYLRSLEQELGKVIAERAPAPP